jgi:hypothetical protein
MFDNRACVDIALVTEKDSYINILKIGTYYAKYPV